ncbi:MAG: hypothetical protein ACRD2L_03525, partial [Terriglobia bacterium]
MSAIWVGLLAKAIVIVGLTWYVLLHIFGLLTVVLPGIASAVVVALLFRPLLLIIERYIGLVLSVPILLVGKIAGPGPPKKRGATLIPDLFLIGIGT